MNTRGAADGLPLPSPDLSSESSGCGDCKIPALYAPPDASPRRLNKLRKMKQPPSSFVPPRQAELSFFAENGRPVSAFPSTLSLGDTFSLSLRRASTALGHSASVASTMTTKSQDSPPQRKLQKKRPQSMALNSDRPVAQMASASTPNLFRRSTTALNIFQKRPAQSRSAYGPRKSTSESGHESAYYVPRNEIGAYFQPVAQASFPPPSGRSSSAHSPRPDSAQPSLVTDLSVLNSGRSFISGISDYLPEIDLTSPMATSPPGSSTLQGRDYTARPSYGKPLPPIPSSPTHLGGSSDLPIDEKSNTGSEQHMSRSSSISKIARALSWNASMRLKPRNSYYDNSRIQPPLLSEDDQSKAKKPRKARPRAKFTPGSVEELTLPLSPPPSRPPSPQPRPVLFHMGPYSEPSQPSAEVIGKSHLQTPPQSPQTNSSFEVVQGYHRPPIVVRKDGNQRRWTLATDLIDEGVSNEALVIEIERMRARRREWGMGTPAQSRSGSVDDVAGQANVSDDHSGCDSGVEGRKRDAYEDEDSVFGGPPGYVAFAQAIPVIAGPNGEIRVPFPSPDSNPRIATPWRTIRRALLTVRELLSTERSYLHNLQLLLAGSCSPAPSELMLNYIRELEKTSATLLESFKNDMTVWGVSRAFLIVFSGVGGREIDESRGFIDASERAEGDGEKAFSSWCSIVGEWFTPVIEENRFGRTKSAPSLEHPARVEKVRPPSRRLSKARGLALQLGSSAPSSAEDLSLEPIPPVDSPLLSQLPINQSQSSPAKKSPTPRSMRSNPWRKSMPSVATLQMTSSPPTSPANDGSGAVSPTPSASTPTRARKLNRSHWAGHGEEKEDNSKKLTPIRDLAILPTQRIMRYVLLYRDLLADTPATSPVRPLIERAVEAAVRVAQKCDRAQDHSAFHRLEAN